MSTDPNDYPVLPDGVLCPVCSANNANAAHFFLQQVQRLQLIIPPIPTPLTTGAGGLTSDQIAAAQTQIATGIAMVQNALKK